MEKNSPKASNSKRLTIANVRPEKSKIIPNQSYGGPDFSAKRSSLPSLPNLPSELYSFDTSSSIELLLIKDVL